MGMLAAVEMWYKRDHAAEWKQWESWLGTIAGQVGKIQGVTTEIVKPSGLSNNTPQLRIRWDGARLGISGRETFDLLLNQRPADQPCGLDRNTPRWARDQLGLRGPLDDAPGGR